MTLHYIILTGYYIVKDTIRRQVIQHDESGNENKRINKMIRKKLIK